MNTRPAAGTGTGTGDFIAVYRGIVPHSEAAAKKNHPAAGAGLSLKNHGGSVLPLSSYRSLQLVDKCVNYLVANF